MDLIVVDANADNAIIREQLPSKEEPRVHHGEPGRVLSAIFVDAIGIRIVRRINIDQFDSAGVWFLEKLENIEVLALNEHVLRFVAAYRLTPIVDERAERGHLQRAYRSLLAGPDEADRL